MNILLITPYIPYPLSEGGKVSQFSVLEYISKKIEVTLSFVVHTDEDHKNTSGLQQALPDVKVLFFDSRKKPGKFKHAQRLLTKTVNGINRIRVIISNEKVQESEYETLIRESNISNAVSEQYFKFLEGILKRRPYDVIQVDHVDYMSLGVMVSKYAPCVFMHHELRFAKIISDVQKNNNPQSHFGDYLAELALSQEKALLKWFNAIMVFSDVDKLKLESSFGKTFNVFTSQFPVMEDAIVAFDKESCIIKKLVFIGGDLHYPNMDAVDWYIQTMADKVYDKTGLQLYIVGNWHESKTSKRESKNVLFTGFVDDLVSFCRNSIMLVPIRIGSGIRTKMLYAMAQGAPVISTSIGAEGIIAEPNVDYMLADTAEDFIEMITLLSQNQAKAFEIAMKAQASIKLSYTQQTAGEKRIKIYKDVVQHKHTKPIDSLEML